MLARFRFAFDALPACLPLAGQTSSSSLSTDVEIWTRGPDTSIVIGPIVISGECCTLE